MRLLEHNIRIVLDSYHNTRTRNSYTVRKVPIVVVNVYFSKSYCNILIPFWLIYRKENIWMITKSDFIEYLEFIKLYMNVD